MEFAGEMGQNIKVNFHSCGSYIVHYPTCAFSSVTVVYIHCLATTAGTQPV